MVLTKKKCCTFRIFSILIQKSNAKLATKTNLVGMSLDIRDVPLKLPLDFLLKSPPIFPFLWGVGHPPPTPTDPLKVSDKLRNNHVSRIKPKIMKKKRTVFTLFSLYIPFLSSSVNEGSCLGMIMDASTV